MTMRDKIADLLTDADYEFSITNEGPSANQLADQILAILPPTAEVIRGMIKPLVWPIDPHHTGIYKTKCLAGVHYTMKIRSPDKVSWRVNYHVGWFRADSEASAQAAANEHHAATILAALKGSDT